LPCNLHKDGRFSSFPEQTAKPKSREMHGFRPGISCIVELRDG